jgi:hypothetical protein
MKFPYLNNRRSFQCETSFGTVQGEIQRFNQFEISLMTSAKCSIEFSLGNRSAQVLGFGEGRNGWVAHKLAYYEAIERMYANILIHSGSIEKNSSSGCALGKTINHSSESSINELIERYVLQLWWKNRLRLSSFEPRSSELFYLTNLKPCSGVNFFLVESSRRSG